MKLRSLSIPTVHVHNSTRIHQIIYPLQLLYDLFSLEWTWAFNDFLQWRLRISFPRRRHPPLSSALWQLPQPLDHALTTIYEPSPPASRQDNRQNESFTLFLPISRTVSRPISRSHLEMPIFLTPQSLVQSRGSMKLDKSRKMSRDPAI